MKIEIKPNNENYCQRCTFMDYSAGFPYCRYKYSLDYQKIVQDEWGHNIDNERPEQCKEENK